MLRILRTAASHRCPDPQRATPPTSTDHHHARDDDARLATCEDDDALCAIGFGTLAVMVDALNPADAIARRARAFVAAVDRRLAELAQVRGPAETN